MTEKTSCSSRSANGENSSWKQEVSWTPALEMHNVDVEETGMTRQFSRTMARSPPERQQSDESTLDSEEDMKMPRTQRDCRQMPHPNTERTRELTTSTTMKVESEAPQMNQH